MENLILYISYFSIHIFLLILNLLTENNLTSLYDLSEIELFHGIFTLTFVAFSILLGFKILLKYFQIKDNSFIFVGLTWIFMSSGWWGSSFSFLSIILFNTPLTTFTYIIVANAFISIAIICWICFTSRMIFPRKRKTIIIIYIIIYSFYEILLIFFLIIDYRLIGEIKGTFFFQPSLFFMPFQIFAAISALITGILFSRQCLKSNDIEIKLKGKFLLIAFILFAIGSIMDAAFPLNPILLVIVRLILIISSIAYYLGFILPKWLENLLIKNK